MDSFPRGIPAVQYHNRSPYVTENFQICQSYMTALSSRTSTYVNIGQVDIYMFQRSKKRALEQGVKSIQS